MIEGSPHLSLDYLSEESDHGQMRPAIIIALCVVLFPLATDDDIRLNDRKGTLSVLGASEIELAEIDLGFTWVPQVTPHLRVSDLGQTPVNPPAERVSNLPPDRRTSGPTAGAPRCRQWEQLLTTAHQRWDVVRLSEIIWRESRCSPEARSPTFDTGLLQINQVNHDYLSTQLGVAINAQSLTDPVLNIVAAAALCEYWERRVDTDCYQPWVATDLRSGEPTNTKGHLLELQEMPFG